MRYKKTKKYHWSPNLAYIVGLITTDGSLSKDNRHIDFTSKDLQLAKIYKDITGTKAKIGIKSSGAGNMAYRVQISDVALYDFFLDIGLTPNKSLTLSELKIPDKYFADFLRGCFDGDGCIYGVIDRRWKNSYMFYTTFASASPKFIDWLSASIRRNLPKTGGCVRVSRKNTLQLAYAKRDSKNLFKFMYYGKDLPCLDRKYRRFLEVFATDPYP